MDAALDYVTELISFVIGAGFGSLLTIQFKKQKATGTGNAVDQSGAKAGGDVVGRDKIEKK